MSLIGIQNLEFSYGYRKIFGGVNLNLDTDWKLGLIGRNGRGKTTFLNILAGKLEHGGKISASVEFDYFPYPVKDVDRLTVEIFSEICPAAEEWEAIRELSYMQTDGEVLYRPFSTLSNGERTKVLLAAMFLNDGRFLLIDEPTNHLDGKARESVARYLRRKKGFILVSHDRAFLDGCVDHILSINRCDIEVVSGNFSVWQENFERRQAFEETQSEKLKKDITRLKETAKTTSDWADKTEASKYGKASSGLSQDKGYVGHKAAKLMKRATVAKERTERAIEEKSELLKNAETCEDLKINPLIYRNERLAEFSGVSVFYGKRTACEKINFEILRGERVALCGKNGCGKSSLLKLLTGEDIAHTGSVKIGSGLVMSYVPQSAEDLHGRLSEYAREKGIDENLFRAILARTDFDKSDFEGDLSALSQGQKKKVLLAGSLAQSAHLYIWDEPLNYIDIYSRMQIEKLIGSAKPTMIFVEHDKTFCDKVATKRIEL